MAREKKSDNMKRAKRAGARVRNYALTAAAAKALSKRASIDPESDAKDLIADICHWLTLKCGFDYEEVVDLVESARNHFREEYSPGLRLWDSGFRLGRHATKHAASCTTNDSGKCTCGMALGRQRLERMHRLEVILEQYAEDDAMSSRFSALAGVWPSSYSGVSEDFIRGLPDEAMFRIGVIGLCLIDKSFAEQGLSFDKNPYPQVSHTAPDGRVRYGEKAIRHFFGISESEYEAIFGTIKPDDGDLDAIRRVVSDLLA